MPFWAGVASLIVLPSMLAALSAWFSDGEGPAWGTCTLVGLLVAAGAVYVLMVRSLCDRARPWMRLPWLLAVGVAMRLPLLPSEPMWEIDYYRYMWDGAVLAEGHNPYRYAPKQILDAAGEGGQVPAELRRLAEERGSTLGKVHYPEYRTIYPLGAQGVFATAHIIMPWSVLGLRLVLALFDVATLLVLLALLRELGASASLIVVYWWNPLLIKELYNSTHMDVIALPFVLGATLLAVRRRPRRSAFLLAIGVGVKLWPVILIPVLLRPWLREPRKLLGSLVIFVAVSMVMFLPVLSAGLDDSSGFVAYGKRWEMNDALFMLVEWIARLAVFDLDASTGLSPLVARGAVTCALAAWVVWQCWRPPQRPQELCQRCLFVLAALFLLSPTQFPWYYTWMLPFLALRPRTSLLLMTALLPLYYLRFYFQLEGTPGVGVFDYGVVWIEYAPVWALLALEWRNARRGRRLAAEGDPLS